MSKKILNLGDSEVEKNAFYKFEYQIDANEVNISKIMT